MNKYCFFDVELKLRSDSTAVITPAYFQGSIESSLTEFFGEIGGQTELELVKFDTDQKRGIFKVPEAFSPQARAAITLIGYFQDIPCHFKVISFKQTFGKDTVIFATKEDHAIPPSIELPPPEPAQGLITKDGEINWSCPCLGGMATGPCGVEFREAFSCFHNSEAEPKGSDCYEAFRTMQDCFTQYPTVYNKSGGSGDDDEDDDGGIDLAALSEDFKEDETSAMEASSSKAVDKQ